MPSYVNVKRLRLDRDLTQEALAHEAKVALRLLGGIERGQRKSDALGMHPRELFGDRSESRAI
jgi:transcriptional regulator with XRE-family HTH domain